MRDDGLIDHVMELLGPFGTVQPRRMFSGHGMFLDGLMFAIVTDGTVFLKTDAINRGEFTQAGGTPLSFQRQGRPMETSYYRAPESAMESAQEMLPWARSAYAAAMRARARKIHDASQPRKRRPKGSAKAVARKVAAKVPVKVAAKAVKKAAPARRAR
jgi:DNA transformation protein